MEENLAQLYDDQFIETCADWVVPYIGDLIGYRALLRRHAGADQPARRGRQHDRLPPAQGHRGDAGAAGPRRHRLGGACGRVLPAAGDHAVHEPHPARQLYAPDLRRWEPLARIGTAFDTVAHTADVRHVNRRRGKLQHPEHRHLPVAAGRVSADPVARGARWMRRAIPSARWATRRRCSPTPRPRTDHPPGRADQRAAPDRPAGAARAAWALLWRGQKPLHSSWRARDAGGQLDPAAAPEPVPAGEILVCDLRDVTDVGGKSSAGRTCRRPRAGSPWTRSWAAWRSRPIPARSCWPATTTASARRWAAASTNGPRPSTMRSTGRAGPDARPDHGCAERRRRGRDPRQRALRRDPGHHRRGRQAG